MIKELKFADHDEWLSIRHQYIGGSDAGAIIGTNPYKSAYSLWAEKTNRIKAFDGNITTEVGAYLEQLVADMFSKETGKKVHKVNRTIVNDLYPYACANIDRKVVGEDALLEIKTTTSIPNVRKLRGSDEFPDIYYAQVVHYLAVTGYSKAYLAVLINCRELKIYELERDQSEIDILMEEERRFWSNVESGTPPVADGAESTADAIREMYPESTDSVIDITACRSALDRYTEISDEIKALKKEQDAIAAEIKLAMRDAATGVCEGYKVSWVSSVRSTFDGTRYANEHPEIDLGGYYKQTNVRTFRVTEKEN